MATTPPRLKSGADDGRDPDYGVATPATPKHGPMFDPDCFSIRDRRKRVTAAGNQIQHTGTKTSQQDYQRESRANEAADETDIFNTADQRLRTRTRTISGPQPGAPMLTPRETPDARRRRRQHDRILETPKESPSLLEVDSEDEEDFLVLRRLQTESTAKTLTKPTARLLFPATTPVKASSLPSPEFHVYEDEESLIHDSKAKMQVFKDTKFTDDPFSESTSISSETPKKRTRWMSAGQPSAQEPPPSKKGMMFVL